MMTSHSDESQKLILDLVERSPIPTLIVSYVDQRHILINGSLQRLLGYTIDDIPTIDDWWPLAYPDEQYSAQLQAAWKSYMARLESGETDIEPVEAKVRCKDNSGKYVSVSSALFGNLQMVIFTDLTDRIKFEEETRTALALLDTIIESTSDGILVVDKDGKILRYNGRFAQIWRIPDSVLAEKSDEKALGYVMSFLAEPDRFISEVRRLYDHPEEKITDIIELKDGRFLERNSHPQRLGEESIGRVWVFRDVTKRIQAQKSLQQSEEKYRNIVENAIEGIFQMLPNGNIVSANPALARIFGVESPEVLVGHFTNMAPEHSGIGIREQLIKALLDNHRLENFELLGKREDGSDIWVSVNAYAAKTEEGSTVFEGTMVDITQRKQSEAIVAEAKEEAERRAAEIESFISNIADGVVLIDGGGEVIYINHAGQEILRMPEGESLDKWMTRWEFHYLDGEALSVEELPFTRGMRGETIQDLRLMVTSPWGSYLIISVSASPVKSISGRILGVTLVFRDQSERMEIERSKEELYEREHRIAQVLQNALLPQRLPDVAPFETAVIYESASREAEVGGDFFDAFEFGDGKIALAIGDVTGKGLPAAVKVATARHTLRSCAHVQTCPSSVMTMANDVLCKSLKGEEDGMLTAVFAVVDSNSRTITIANGGHEPLLIKRGSGDLEQVCVTGRVLGVMGDFTYPEMQKNLAPDDLVVMVTDGITEARNNKGDFFGIEGVSECLKNPDMKSPSYVVAAILSSAKDFTGGTLRDDAAILCLALRNTP